MSKSKTRETIESLVIAIVLAAIIRTFIVQAFKIPTGSMRPTLIEGDRILVNKFIYRFQDPRRGDVIVFRYPENPRLAYIKRLVGLPEEELELDDGNVIIDGEAAEEEQVGGRFYYNRGPFGTADEPIPIPADNYFVLGDNSANSRDSRYWGFVPRENLLGRAFVIYWPPNRWRLIK